MFNQKISVVPEKQGPTVLTAILENEKVSSVEKLLDRIFPIFLFLEGPLGSGKTEFTKSFFKSLGGDSTKIQSPTFLKAIEHELHGGKKFIHADFYRLENSEQISQMGFFESVENASFVIIEWPQFIHDLHSDDPLKKLLAKSSVYNLRWQTLGVFEWVG